MRSAFSSLLLMLLTFRLAALPLAERVRLTTEHVDLRIVLAPEGTNLFQFMVRDEDGRTNHPATNAVLVAAESAKLTVPDGFPQLGPGGSDLWVLPQSQNPALLYLGISAEGLPGGLITGRAEVRLTRLDGPGHFIVWQADALAGLVFSVNTRDGIGEEDQFQLLVGSHAHHNWGFSTNGLFTAWFQVRATVGGTNAWSPETPILFAVEPLPEVPAEPAVLTAGLEPDGSLRLLLTGTPEATYRVEGSADFVEWEQVAEVTATTAPQVVPVALPAHSPPRFFRATTP